MNKKIKRERRRKRIRAKLMGTKKRPRLSVFRSNKYLFVQLIDDVAGKTLLGMSEKTFSKKGKLTKVEIASLLGEALAKKAKSKKISTIVFDRAGYKYHGRVKVLADGVRKGGLKF